MRVRPLSEREKKQQFKLSCKVNEINSCIQVHKPDAPSGEPPKEFTFDSVFGMDSKQVCIFNFM